MIRPHSGLSALRATLNTLLNTQFSKFAKVPIIHIFEASTHYVVLSTKIHHSGSCGPFSETIFLTLAPEEWQETEVTCDGRLVSSIFSLLNFSRSTQSAFTRLHSRSVNLLCYVRSLCVSRVGYINGISDSQILSFLPSFLQCIQNFHEPRIQSNEDPYASLPIQSTWLECMCVSERSPLSLENLGYQILFVLFFRVYLASLR